MARNTTLKANALKLKENQQVFRDYMRNLRDAGVVPKSVDLRKVKLTDHYSRLIRQNNEIARGIIKRTEIKHKEAITKLEELNKPLVTRGKGKNKKTYLESRMHTNSKGIVSRTYNTQVLKDGRIKKSYTRQGYDGRTYRIDQYELPVKFEDIEQWLDDAYDYAFSQDLNLKPNEKVFFKYFGNYSLSLHNSYADAIEIFSKYDSFRDAEHGRMSYEHMQEMISGIGIQRTTETTSKYNRDRITAPDKVFSKKRQKTLKKNAQEEREREQREIQSHADAMKKKRQERAKKFKEANNDAKEKSKKK